MSKNKTLLITGGAGFIGSNFINYMHQEYPNYTLVNLDKLTYAGSKENVSELDQANNVHFIKGDIADEALVAEIFDKYQISDCIHFAAESHVDRSIADAKAFVETNVMGTIVLLQAAKNYWAKLGTQHTSRFHHISTDEIYGSLGPEGMFNEETPLNPRNPYSASKAGSNFLVKSFGYTYDMNVVITSCSNNYGPKQHDEKLIPTIIFNALSGNPIPIYGNGQNIRDWIYVMDHCRALDLVFHKAKKMETFNIGGGNEKTNIDLATEICRILNTKKADRLQALKLESYTDLITFTEDRLGHDLRYAVDDTKVRETFGWKPKESIQTGLQKTIDWYVDKWKTQTH